MNIVAYNKLSLDVLNGDVFASVIVKFKEEIGILMEEKRGKKTAYAEWDRKFSDRS